MSKRRRPPTDNSTSVANEKTLFMEAMADVKPLAAENLHPTAATQQLKQAKRARQAATQSARHPKPPTAVNLEPLAEKWQRPNQVSKAEARTLGGDQFRTHGELDLHHMQADQARHQLRKFLDQADRDDCSRLRIVHGRGLHSDGRAVLPELVQDELRHDPRVLAFRLAGRSDGGAGAVRVLFKPRN